MKKSQVWEIPKYTKRQINQAGEIIRKDVSTKEEIDDATKVIDNWRASHAYPLHIVYVYLRKLAKKTPGALVVERLKRLDSIVDKLRRTPNMELWRMQDLGGCRCIVSSVPEVFELAEAYQKSKIGHEYKRTYNYINEPKTSGYRSLHLVYKFHSKRKQTYNQNMLIEIQFRSYLQHIWATTLETMGIFTRQKLKADQGNEHVKRFFVLVSSLFALEENCPVVTGTIADERELIKEIKEINANYNVLDTLSAIKVFLDIARGLETKKSGYFMLILNFNTRRLRVRYFMPSEIEEANEIYSQIEKNRVESKIDAVLVRADSFKELKAAYPNYFADISEFVKKVNKYILKY